MKVFLTHIIRTNRDNFDEHDYYLHQTLDQSYNNLKEFYIKSKTGWLGYMELEILDVLVKHSMPQAIEFINKFSNATPWKMKISIKEIDFKGNAFE